MVTRVEVRYKDHVLSIPAEMVLMDGCDIKNDNGFKTVAVRLMLDTFTMIDDDYWMTRDRDWS